MAKRPVAVVNPRHIRDVAQATGPLAKTEALDAGVIAHFAAAVHPMPRPLPEELTQQLDARLQRRRQLLEMVVAERHRMALAHPTLRDSLMRHLDDRQRRLDETAAAISPRIRTSPAWRESEDVLQSTPGIGPVLSATRQAALPEGGIRNQREIAKLVGVAPLHDESGKPAGARQIRGGRAKVRAV